MHFLFIFVERIKYLTYVLCISKYLLSSSQSSLQLLFWLTTFGRVVSGEVTLSLSKIIQDHPTVPRTNRTCQATSSLKLSMFGDKFLLNFVSYFCKKNDKIRVNITESSINRHNFYRYYFFGQFNPK